MPNRAAFSFGVTTQAKSAAAALNGNNSEMRKVIDAIKRAGVAARDVQTSSVSLSPRYSQNGEDIVGYTASNTVNATIRSISRSGAVIDAAVGAGANQVYGPSFTRLRRDRALPPGAGSGRRERAREGADARRRGQGAARPACARSSRSSAGPVPIAEKAAAAADVGRRSSRARSGSRLR